MIIYVMKTIDNYISEKLYIGKDYYAHSELLSTILNMTNYSDNDKVRQAVKDWIDKFKINKVEYITDFNYNGRYDNYINDDFKHLVEYSHEIASALNNDINNYLSKDWNVKIDDDFSIYWSKKCLCFCWNIEEKQINLFIRKID